jgi:hypothetical protein
MVQYRGFICDGCGKVMDIEGRTKITVRYEGFVEGEYFEDKCSVCAVPPDGVTLKPLRRRKPQPLTT